MADAGHLTCRDGGFLVPEAWRGDLMAKSAGLAYVAAMERAAKADAVSTLVTAGFKPGEAARLTGYWCGNGLDGPEIYPATLGVTAAPSKACSYCRSIYPGGAVTCRTCGAPRKQES